MTVTKRTDRLTQSRRGGGGGVLRSAAPPPKFCVNHAVFGNLFGRVFRKWYIYSSVKTKVTNSVRLFTPGIPRGNVCAFAKPIKTASILLFIVVGFQNFSQNCRFSLLIILISRPEYLVCRLEKSIFAD